MLKTTLAITAVILLTVLPAVLQGRFVNRWGTPRNLSVAGKQLHEFPRQVGDWISVEDERPLSESVCRELGLVEHFHRQYVHAESGERLDVLLMVGPPGRLVRHPPEVCYANRANQQVGDVLPLEVKAGTASHQFKLLNFTRKSQPMPSYFWVAYAYSTEEGRWHTPSSPRMEFGNAHGLYKLQVLAEATDDGAQQRVQEFLGKFVESFPAVLAETRIAEAVAASSENNEERFNE